MFKGGYGLGVLWVVAIITFGVIITTSNKAKNSGDFYTQAVQVAKECPLAKDYFRKRLFEEEALSSSDVKVARKMCLKSELFTELNK